MVFICIVVRSVCGIDFHTGEGGDRGGQLQSRDCHQDGRRGGHGVGDGLSDKRTGRDIRDQQKELDISRTVGTGDGSVMAVLLPCTAGRGGFQGRADRQAQRCHHAGARIRVPA